MNAQQMFRDAQKADQQLSERLGWNTRMGVPPTFKQQPVTRENLQRQAMELWPHSFAKVDEDDIEGALREMWRAPKTEHMALLLRTPMGQVACFAAARWAHYGFPIVQYANHRYAAALMATKVPEGDILPPWKTFLIELPTGLLRTRGSTGEYEDLAYCLVSRHSFVKSVEGTDTTFEGWTYDTYTREGVNLSNHRQTTEELRNGTDERIFDDESPFAYKLEDEDTRTLMLISRLVLNTCTAMSNPEIVRPIGKHPRGEPVGPPRNVKQPTSRVFRVGRDITLDCREALRSFVEGRRRGPLTVQFLVRGHWRQQACGVRFQDRRATWIEPYWKGPEDAPIPVRGIKVSRDAR